MNNSYGPASLIEVLAATDTQPIWLSLKLASVTTVLLLLIATPIAWYLTWNRRWYSSVYSAIATLPLVLPPSVLGFYLLVLLGSNGPLAQLGLGTLAFSFPGLVFASIIYSFPFALQPLQNSFQAIGREPLEAAATLGASKLDTFFSVVLPLSRPGLLTATVLVFAHTIGEFGVILMIGGNIPGETRVLSVAIYDHVETMEYTQAHILSFGMVMFAFLVVFALHRLNRPGRLVGKQVRP